MDYVTSVVEEPVTSESHRHAQPFHAIDDIECYRIAFALMKMPASGRKRLSSSRGPMTDRFALHLTIFRKAMGSAGAHKILAGE